MCASRVSVGAEARQLQISSHLMLREREPQTSEVGFGLRGVSVGV
jgi:hypothetical protein